MGIGKKPYASSVYGDVSGDSVNVSFHAASGNFALDVAMSLLFFWILAWRTGIGK